MSKKNEIIQLAIYASQFYKNVQQALAYDKKAKTAISSKVSEEQNAALSTQLKNIFTQAQSIQRLSEDNKELVSIKEEEVLAQSVIDLVDQFVKVSSFAYDDQKLYTFLPCEIRNSDRAKQYLQHNASNLSKLCQHNSF
jgi:hypothetical protein